MAKRDNDIRVEQRGDGWAAVDPSGEELGAYTTQQEAQAHATAYAEVFSIIAQDTGQAIRFGTSKPEKPAEKQERLRRQANDAAKQYVRAQENLRDPTFAAPADAPEARGVRRQASGKNVLAEQASGPRPDASSLMPDASPGLTEADVRRIVSQESRKLKGKGQRKTVAEAGQTQPPVQPPRKRQKAEGGRRKKAARRRERPRPYGTAAAIQEPRRGGFVLEDASTELTAKDLSRMLAGQFEEKAAGSRQQAETPSATATATVSQAGEQLAGGGQLPIVSSQSPTTNHGQPTDAPTDHGQRTTNYPKGAERPLAETPKPATATIAGQPIVKPPPLPPLARAAEQLGHQPAPGMPVPAMPTAPAPPATTINPTIAATAAKSPPTSRTVAGAMPPPLPAGQSASVAAGPPPLPPSGMPTAPTAPEPGGDRQRRKASARAPAGPVAAAASSSPPVGIPPVAGPPTNAPQPSGAGGGKKRPPRNGKATLWPDQEKLKPSGRVQIAPVKVVNGRELAKAIGEVRAKQIDKAVHHLCRCNRSRPPEEDKQQQQQRGKKEDKKRTGPRETRTSSRLLEKSKKQLSDVFKPVKNALENVSNVFRSHVNQRIGDLSKKLGIDKLFKTFERQTRGLAASIARKGGGRGLLGSAGRPLAQGAMGRAGASLAGRGVAAGAAAGAADTAGADAAAAAGGGAVATAGAAVEAGVAIAAFGAAVVATTVATVLLGRRMERTGREMLEAQRDMSRLHAGVAASFAQLDRATLMQQFHRADATSASINLMTQAQARLQNNMNPWHAAGQNIGNTMGAAMRNTASWFIEVTGIGKLGEFMEWVTEKFSIGMGGKKGPKGNAALRFIDEVAAGNWRNAKNRRPPKM